MCFFPHQEKPLQRFIYVSSCELHWIGAVATRTIRDGAYHMANDVAILHRGADGMRCSKQESGP